MAFWISEAGFLELVMRYAGVGWHLARKQEALGLGLAALWVATIERIVGFSV